MAPHVQAASAASDAFLTSLLSRTARNYTAGSDIIPNPSWGVGGPPSSSPAPNFTYATPSSRPDGNHFLDFSSVLLKNEHGVVNRVPVPPGACLPGNLLMVRTSAASYPTITTPATPSMDPTSLIYTTTADDITNGDLTVFQPRTNNRKVTVYFALNYGLRNALDNPYDSTGSNPKYTYGGYYVSNLTTALLGDPSKGLGVRARALPRACAAARRAHARAPSHSLTASHHARSAL